MGRTVSCKLVFVAAMPRMVPNTQCYSIAGGTAISVASLSIIAVQKLINAVTAYRHPMAAVGPRHQLGP